VSGAANARVGVIGCRHTTLDVVNGLRRRGFAIASCITIGPQLAARHRIPGFVELTAQLADTDIEVLEISSYGGESAEDRQRVLELGLDVLLVAGWGRLIGDWLLDSLPLGAYGVHGSPRPLPFGRGRSPVNWAIAEGRETFFTHLFQLTAGVDEGPIVGSTMFEVTPFDDALTVHLKNTTARLNLYERLLPSILAGDVTYETQREDGSSYYEKRTEADNTISWEEDTWTIFNLVRAITRPFSGARTYLGGTPVTVWRAIPFDDRLVRRAALPGEIVEVYFDGEFVVKTGNTALLVREHDGPRIDESTLGARFHQAP
jgi:methionyl-tRNA formyltransferase